MRSEPAPSTLPPMWWPTTSTSAVYLVEGVREDVRGPVRFLDGHRHRRSYAQDVAVEPALADEEPSLARRLHDHSGCLRSWVASSRTYQFDPDHQAFATHLTD